MLTPLARVTCPVYVPAATYTSRGGLLAAAVVTAFWIVRLGCAIVPGLLSLPMGLTKMAREASPSIPSQFESRNIRSGTSGIPSVRHSQPLDMAPRGALRSPFESTAPIWQLQRHSPIVHATSALARAGQAIMQPPQCMGLVMKSCMGSLAHRYVEPEGMQVSVVQGFMSSHDGGALRMQRRRAASQDQVPMHALLLSRWQVVSPISQGTSATQPDPSTQNCPLGQRMSLGTCKQRPAMGSQRSSVHDTLSSHDGTPPTTTHRPPMQRCALVQRSGAVQSSSMRHERASTETTSWATPVSAVVASAPTSARASGRTPESGRVLSISAHEARKGTSAIVERYERRSMVQCDLRASAGCQGVEPMTRHHDTSVSHDRSDVGWAS